MNDLMNHASHLLHFDGLIHWCFLIAVFVIVVGVVWVVMRVLLPLHRLSRQAAQIIQGKGLAFDAASGGIREIERLRTSLQYMVEQMKQAQEREIAYRNALTETQENERKRIARDIHDDTIQSLVLVSHSLERAMNPATVQPVNAGHLEQARTQLIQTIDNLRQMIVNLRPTILDELGLAAAIEVLCEKHPALEFSVIGEAYGIDQAQELAIFRAAQEAVYNAERHARARHITATLTYSKSAVTLEVCDDGIGFEIPRQLQEFAIRGHYGLIGIRERILHLGGQLNLRSEQSAGTRVTVTVPGEIFSSPISAMLPVQPAS